MSHFKKRENKTTCLKDCVKWGRKSMLFIVDGISLLIKSEREMLEVTIENFERNRFDGMARYLGLFCDRVKQEIVDKMAAEILAFFIRPQEGKKKRRRCNAEHVKFLLHQLVRISFTYTIGKNPSSLEVYMTKWYFLLFNLHQDFLKGKQDEFRELARTLCWTGKNLKEKLKKDEQLKLIRAHRANGQRKISKSRRLKVRAYFA
ncbi:hypothetical protein MKX03_004587 [Papaver bracteatum]|nr:hypothetical protein MKX03_004587 [Papaver bracteatum]